MSNIDDSDSDEDAIVKISNTLDTLNGQPLNDENISNIKRMLKKIKNKNLKLKQENIAIKNHAGISSNITISSDEDHQAVDENKEEMDDKDREKIDKNVDVLIAKTDYEKLKFGCVRHGIITEAMKRRIENYDDVLEQKKQLWIKITKRGPTAFGKLKTLLNELNFFEALKILDPDEGMYSNEMNSTNNKTNNHNNVREVQANETSREEVDTKLFNVREINDRVEKLNITDQNKLLPFENITENLINIKKDTIANPQPPQTSGIFFLVNYTDDRINTDKEKNYLLSFFKGLNFWPIFYCENPTYEELHSYFHDLKFKYFKENITRCFVYAHLGNNINDKLIFKLEKPRETKEYGYCSTIDIINAFNSKNCQYLLDTTDGIYYPDAQKIFIFPSVAQSSVSIHKCTQLLEPFENDRIKAQKNIREFSTSKPTLANTIYFYFERDEREKSFLNCIQNFCEIMGEYGHQYSFQTLLKLYHKKTKRADHSYMREFSEYGIGESFLLMEIDKHKELI